MNVLHMLCIGSMKIVSDVLIIVNYEVLVLLCH